MASTARKGFSLSIWYTDLTPLLVKFIVSFDHDVALLSYFDPDLPWKLIHDNNFVGEYYGYLHITTVGLARSYSYVPCEWDFHFHLQAVDLQVSSISEAQVQLVDEL